LVLKLSDNIFSVHQNLIYLHKFHSPLIALAYFEAKARVRGNRLPLRTFLNNKQVNHVPSIVMHYAVIHCDDPK